MRKTLTAGLTALSLVLFPAAPVHAQQSSQDLNRAIIGLLAVGAVGLALKESAENRSTATPQRNERHFQPTQRRLVEQAHDNRGNGHKNGHARSERRVDLVPGRCFRRVETARGDYQGIFDGRCLDRRYRDANTLPRQCAVRMGGRDGHRTGYDASCLRDFGYQSDRRWN